MVAQESRNDSHILLLRTSGYTYIHTYIRTYVRMYVYISTI